jgi:glycosyltransferase involved in cell wall biosynthesis
MATTEPFAIRASALRQRLWRKAGPYYNFVMREGLARSFPPARPRSLGPGRDVRLVGLLSTATGIGQSARLCIADLERNNYRVAKKSLSRLFGVDQRVPYPAGPDRLASEALTIYHLNPPLMLLGMVASGLRSYYRSANVAYWAWELPELPPEWVVALSYVDAVMVPSRFCRDIVARHTDKPVLVVPHPVTALMPSAPAARQRDGGPFRVLNAFNCSSSLYRKNPDAIIDAFKLAFGTDSGAELILKVSDGRQHKADIALLESRIGGAPNIRIVDSLMSSEELDTLFRSVDAYVSLHRSEGFGLTVAEAVMRELPVVVTDWSGTTDFCEPGLAYAVENRLVPVADPHPAYCSIRDAVWAEPSVEDAARQLSEIRSRPQEARSRAVELKRRLVDHIADHSYAAAIDTLRRTN